MSKQDRDDIMQQFADALASQMAERNITSPTEYLSNGRYEGIEYSAGIDGLACECGGTDGVIIFVGRNHPSTPDAMVDQQSRLAICTYKHKQGIAPINMSADQAKELVNRLVDAIAVADRVDAEEGSTK